MQALAFSAVSAVALPAHEQEFAPGTKATVSGWGYLSENGEAASLLQAAELEIISDAKCARAYAGTGGAAKPQPHTSICAKEKGKDSCQVWICELKREGHFINCKQPIFYELTNSRAIQGGP